MTCKAHDEIERAQRAYRSGDRDEAERHLERAERDLRYSGNSGERYVRDALSDLRGGGDAHYDIDRAERTVEYECRLEEQHREDERRQEEDRQRTRRDEQQREAESAFYDEQQHYEQEQPQ